jgi:hypothetical protein
MIESFDFPRRSALSMAACFLLLGCCPCTSLLYAQSDAAEKPEGSPWQGSFPEAKSIKGLQVEMLDDAIQLGVKHATFNLNLSQLIAPGGGESTESWERNGETYHFHRDYVQKLDRQVKELSDRDVLVYMILLAYESHDANVNRILLHPDYDATAPNRLGAFNTVTDEGAGWWEAACEFMADRWSRPDQRQGRVVGYIVGNEVNSHWWWSNMGRVSMEVFAEQYERTVRLAHDAIRRQAAWPRVYLSLEHHWNIRYPAGDELQSFAARPFLEHFAAVARQQGDFAWHVAFHPYPENLFEPRFWEDESATHSADTARITFRNLGQLTEFLQRPPMQYQGQSRRVILSEQGFHTPAGEDGEAVQAAAYCYAYKIVETLQDSGIDAFILHRHVDHPHEGGLHLGLRRFDPEGDPKRPRKKIYECFQAADTPGWEAAFSFALPIIGHTNWGEAVKQP